MKDIELQTPEIQEKIRIIEKSIDGRISDAYETAKEVMAYATQHRNVQVCGFCHTYFARYAYLKGDIKECMSHVRSGIRLQEECGDYASLSVSYNLLGIDAMNHGEYPIALEYFEQALDYKHEKSNATGAALVNIGHIYYEVGDFNKALGYCRRGRAVLEKVNRPFSLMIELSQEATYDIWSKRLTKGREVMDELEKLTDRLKRDYPDEVITELYEVQIYYYDTIQEPEKRDEAFRNFLEALKKVDGSFIDYSENINWICDTLFNSGKLDYVGELLSLTRESVLRSGIPYMQLQFLERDIKFNLRMNQLDTVHQLESKYFQISCIKNRENLRIYRTNINIHNDLKRLREERDRMEEENRRLFREATIDPLTQIPNRALLNQKAEDIFARAFENQVPLGVEMLDVDFFKEFNDTYGHQKGDRCLQLVANVLQTISDENTFIARYGGDEFMVIYYGMTDEEIMQKARCIRDTVVQMKVENQYSSTGFLSVSQGIRNSVPVDGNRVWDFTYTADIALYKVKKRNKGDISLIHSVNIAQTVLNE